MYYVGRLAVLTKSDRNDDGSKRWELFGDQLHDWKRASIEIPDMDDLYEVDIIELSIISNKTIIIFQYNNKNDLSFIL